MYFSEAFNIENPGEKDWFNLWLESDTKLYIDPMLVYQSNHPDFSKTYEKIKIFFKEAFNRVAIAKNTKSSQMRSKALEMLKFNEPRELYLGYTNYGSKGSAIGDGYARQIFDAMVDFIELDFADFGEYISPLEIFVEQIGADRISDMMANLMKEDLIKYTQNICKKYNIPMKQFLSNNICFDKNLGWIHGRVLLPENPLDKKSIILVPKEFLRTNSYLDREDFLDYILHMDNITLRQQATRLFTQDLNKKKLVEIIKQNPGITKELFENYLNTRKKEKAKPYPFGDDPLFLNEVKRLVEQAVSKIDKTINLPSEDFSSLKLFVEKIIKEFKQHAESNDGYRILFNDDGSPRGEKISQNLFHAIARGFCKENGKIDLNPEAATGKGPVDFKFSNGADRIMVELKLAKNKQRLYQGLESEIPTYLEASNLNLAYYVVIKQISGDGVRIAELKDRYEKQKLGNEKEIILEVVDASEETKVSASNVKSFLKP